MQEKELRLAVVLTGGISLAIYMHGVAKELHKLARASRAFHRRPDGNRPDSYKDTNRDREVDTERLYFELLESLSSKLELRVVIDVIAGASAGGVNGILLARALAHDLDMDSHRQIWLERADVLRLIDEKSAASSWRRMYMTPFSAVLSYSRLRELAPEPETRQKLAEFVRSRWFHPPFSGPRYTSWLFEACEEMSRNAPESGSLLPDRHPLDLFVSVTDFYGHANRIALHDPPVIEELDHRHLLHYRYLRASDGSEETDFDTGSIPGLVFAARATSSFPGAFPPASVAEIEKVMNERGGDWPARDKFIRAKLSALAVGRSNERLEDIQFIDGSVVNDTPFASAVAAITGRPAQREVMRRIVFVHPNPIDAVAADDTGDPGFFRTILSSLAEIPRNEPINDDLERISAFNQNIRLISQVLRQSRPLVDRFVASILPPEGADIKPTAKEIAAWRNQTNEQAVTDAGYAFHNYFHLKILQVARRLETLIATMVWPEEGVRDIPSHSRLGFLSALSDFGIGDATLGAPSTEIEPSLDAIDFLKRFDVDFRIRRLRFVIRRLNELYRVAAVIPEISARTDRLDELKTTLYGLLEDLNRRWSPAYFAAEIGAGLAEDAKEHGLDPAPVSKGLTRIGEEMSLIEVDSAVDEVFAVMVLNYIPDVLRRDLFAAYIGFPFFDVMSFPMSQRDDLEELEEILIDRISPADATGIRTGGTPVMLKGISLRRFGAFFNRGYRENDYLWGRLNAAERLVDIVLSAVSESEVFHDIDTGDIKQRLFEAILDAEEPHLKANADLIPAIRSEIAARRNSG
jgi:patatin-related protein